MNEALRGPPGSLGFSGRKTAARHTSIAKSLCPSGKVLSLVSAVGRPSVTNWWMRFLSWMEARRKRLRAECSFRLERKDLRFEWMQEPTRSGLGCRICRSEGNGQGKWHR